MASMKEFSQADEFLKDINATYCQLPFCPIHERLYE